MYITLTATENFTESNRVQLEVASFTFADSSASSAFSGFARNLYLIIASIIFI
jgi:hypothetical protein